MVKLTAKKLTPEEIKSIVDKKKQWILSACNPKKIILFGSAATQDMTEASDVDLIVIFNSKDEISCCESKLYSTRPKDDWPHDLLFYDEKTFKENVKKGGGACWIAENEGQVIYSS